MSNIKENLVTSESKLSIHDTEFLLRLFQASSIQGRDLDQAKITCDKIKKISFNSVAFELKK
mgnify:CR=1 FL=1